MKLVHLQSSRQIKESICGGIGNNVWHISMSTCKECLLIFFKDKPEHKDLLDSSLKRIKNIIFDEEMKKLLS